MGVLTTMKDSENNEAGETPVPEIHFHSWLEPAPPPSEAAPRLIGFDYYVRPLAMLHAAYAKSPRCSRSPHPIRSRFWQFVPAQEYDTHEARDLLAAYLRAVETEIAGSVRQASLAFCLHLYRRILPGSIGEDTQPATVALTRAVFEAAVQKYAALSPCSRIGDSKAVPEESVFGGLLMAPEFDLERKLLTEGGSQLVLTDFTERELSDLYDVERLAYEVWRVGATSRSIGKGAPFVVETSETRFRDDRSDEMDELLEIYDERTGRLSSSAIGAVFADLTTQPLKTGFVFLPFYNVAGMTTDPFRDAFRHLCGLEFPDGFRPNFVWMPFNIRGFREVHLPLSEAFLEYHAVTLDTVLAVVAAMAVRVFHLWRRSKGSALFRYWQRAYEGPDHKSNIAAVLKPFLPGAALVLGIPEQTMSNLDIAAGVEFWTLKHSVREDMDLAYSGPHSVFLPYNETHVFTDYAWILRRLFNLFFRVSINDQNFKGDALEQALQSPPSVLPRKACEALDGEKRQIDYATPVGPHLVIAECKAVARSITYDRGDPKAIRYRQERVIEASLREADDKAWWLAQNPRGKNYDVTNFDDILPVGVSPFVEFIPSLGFRYWVSPRQPRVVTPAEFRDLVADRGRVSGALNRVSIRK